MNKMCWRWHRNEEDSLDHLLPSSLLLLLLPHDLVCLGPQRLVAQCPHPRQGLHLGGRVRGRGPLLQPLPLVLADHLNAVDYHLLRALKKKTYTVQ